MVRVCTKWFPNEKNPAKSGYYIDDQLKLQLDILLKNAMKDWDFTILVSGGGEVRVGKSKLAMDIACYWAYQMNELHGIKVPFTLKDNYVFDGRRLIQQGNYLGRNYPHAPLVYDEAGADLEGRKTMQTLTQDVLDFYRECGQYDLLNILVLPEYFDLPKGIALSRSMFLLDVYYTSNDVGLFIRGYFNFYSKRQKKWLYLKGKQTLNYKAVKYDFHGRFYNFYQLPEKDYRKLKQEALMKRENKRRNKVMLQRDACWYILWSGFGWTQSEIAKRMEQLTGFYVSRVAITDGISHFKMENEERGERVGGK